MRSQAPDSDELAQYLLGKLTSERLEHIEQRILLDDDFHQEVEIAEEDLLDNYVNGKLTTADQQLFEANYLTSSLRRQKLLFALALRKKSATAEPRLLLTSGWPRSPYAYASIALMVVVAILASSDYRLTKQLQKEQAHAFALAKDLEAAHQHESGATGAGWGPQDALVLASLRPGGSRGEGLQEISLPSGVRAVQFSLQVPVNFGGEAQVELLNDKNQVITTLLGINPQRIGNKAVIIATFSRDHLSRGNYFLRVRGKQPDSIQLQYSFNISNPEAVP